MSPQLWWDNLLAYSLQIALLVSLGGVLPLLLRMKLPAARLLFWRFALAACLLLPALQGWKRPLTIVTGVVAQAPLRMLPVVPAAGSWPLAEIALALLGCGVAVRMAWLGVGMLRLRRYRRAAAPLDRVSAASSDLVTALAPGARLYISADVASPVTFGVLRPVVLLPVQFPAMAAAARHAIVCHELLHIARRDWLFTVAEECVRAVFWFHPAIWWLLGRIQLSREQTVDREVLNIAASANDYVDALLAVAGAKPQPDLALAPLFLRRRHLKQRVVSILEDVPMSKQRFLPVFAAGLAGLAVACWLAATAFPLAASPQLVVDADGVTVDAGDAVLLHRAAVEYPAEASRKGIQGMVTVEVTVAADGTVSDARVVSGPEELRRAALQSVLRWHFTRASGPGVRMVNISFRAPAPPSAAPGGIEPPKALKSLPALESDSPLSATTVAGAIEIRGIPKAAEDELRARLPVREGDALDRDWLPKLTTAVREYDEHLQVSYRGDAYGKRIVVQISAPGEPNSSRQAQPMMAVPPPTPGVQRIRIGGNIQQEKLVSKPRPVYPPLAKQAHIQGAVQLQVLIDKDGAVTNIAVISGHPLLLESAIEAVRQWKYATTLLNGNPVEVLTQVDVNYTLKQ